MSLPRRPDVGGERALVAGRERRAHENTDGRERADDAEREPGSGEAAATGAPRIYVTHGATGPLVQWLGGQGLDAQSMKTEFEGEGGAEEAGA